MGAKIKGSNAERQLLHMFYNNGWASMRAAGSGSIPIPSPDLVAGNGSRLLAIECKASKADKKYIQKHEIDQLREFAQKLGAEAWIAVRFDRTDWRFLSLGEIEEKGKSFLIEKNKAVDMGKSFHELTGRNI